MRPDPRRRPDRTARQPATEAAPQRPDVSRLTEPVLMGLAVLAVRNRVKR
ncbi:hypothetical protein [Streptomyces echinatus]|uniref:Uncharacterized protein n=1 Tax=Streptomyces echinatus TaxID=67293 RepID=A0A7W9UUY1_9ACTN|nr:hypothetical protein [Streptomyces echinatus]MBB5932190.1 hypothetical protein [Streptomyces echinatus]